MSAVGDCLQCCNLCLDCMKLGDAIQTSSSQGENPCVPFLFAILILGGIILTVHGGGGFDHTVTHSTVGSIHPITLTLGIGLIGVACLTLYLSPV